jgi:hypothetical protein
MEEVMEWAKANTWVAEWVGTMVAIFVVILPPLARYFGVNRNSVDAVKEESPFLWLVMKGMTNWVVLLVVCAFEFAVLVLALLFKASVECLGLYVSAIFLLILLILSSIREEISERDKRIG